MTDSSIKKGPSKNDTSKVNMNYPPANLHTMDGKHAACIVHFLGKKHRFSRSSLSTYWRASHEAWSLVSVEHVDVNDCKCLLLVIRPIWGKNININSVRCHPFPDIFSWNTEENWGVYPLPCHSATAMAIDGWIFTSHRYFPTGWGPWRYWSYGFYNLKTIAGYGSIPI
jgi:hypothetical protein